MILLVLDGKNWTDKFFRLIFANLISLRLILNLQVAGDCFLSDRWTSIFSYVKELSIYSKESRPSELNRIAYNVSRAPEVWDWWTRCFKQHECNKSRQYFKLTEIPKFLVSAVIGCMHCLFLVLDILKQKKPNKFSAFLSKRSDWYPLFCLRSCA